MLKITLDMKVPTGLEGLSSFPESEWYKTLEERAAALKSEGIVRVVDEDDEATSELTTGFYWKLQYGEIPTIGQVWAAYYVAKMEQLESEYYSHGSITTRQFAARKGALRRLVFRKK